MFRELSKKLYVYIIQVELMFLRFYKIDPFTMFQGMTIIDVQSLVQSIEEQNRKDRENKQSDKLMKSLVAIRDILNYMTLPERG